MGRFCLMLLSCAVVLIWHVSARAQTVDLSGQASGWVTAKREDTQVGFRYIPGLSLVRNLSEIYKISAEAAVNARWSGRFDGVDHVESRSAVDPYRLWVRFASPRYEIRAGLQKISFGSATLLRPLMWFDSVDPRDPLQLTNGVYGLLGRYYYPDNANIWMWALYGNEDLKGWETLPGDKREVELGGRLQMPIRAGEMGLSYHHRRVDPKAGGVGALHPLQGKFPEDRLGIDGKWDVGAGLWFEGTVTRRDIDAPERPYQRMLTVGADYTFALGNGPHLLFEQFVRDEAQHAFGSGKGGWLSALSIDYPLSVLDKVAAIVYYDWDRNEWSRLLQWQRSYDKWQVHVSAFWNPDQISPTWGTTAIGSFAGKGVQLMLVFNH